MAKATPRDAGREAGPAGKPEMPSGKSEKNATPAGKRTPVRKAAADKPAPGDEAVPATRPASGRKRAPAGKSAPTDLPAPVDEVTPTPPATLTPGAAPAGAPTSVDPARTRGTEPDRVNPVPTRETAPDHVDPAPTRETEPDHVDAAAPVGAPPPASKQAAAEDASVAAKTTTPPEAGSEAPTTGTGGTRPAGRSDDVAERPVVALRASEQATAPPRTAAEETRPETREAGGPGSQGGDDTSLWSRLRGNPGYAAELAALAAVARFGRQAAGTVAALREAYPSATPDGIARLVVRHFLRRSRIDGAAAGLAGPLGVLVDAAALATTQARLVLHLAAAYGLDPTDPERAAEILVLQRIHPSVETARAALAAAQDPAPVDRSTRGEAAVRLTTPVGRLVGFHGLSVGLARRLVRRIPGATAAVGAVTGARATERIATRALAHYRGLARSR